MNTKTTEEVVATRKSIIADLAELQDLVEVGQITDEEAFEMAGQSIDKAP